MKHLPALLCLLLFAACGAQETPATWTRDCAGKPAPAIGDVRLEVVERPAADRVVLEARWAAGPRGSGRRVELVLPDGAWLIEGRRRNAVRADARDGVIRWTIGYETGRPLDVVARLRAQDGEREVGREVCVPLD